MHVNPATTPWLRRARWAVAITALACVGVGLHWVYRAAMVGDVADAMAAAALCLAVLALDFVAGAVLRMGGLVLRSTRRIEDVENRLAALEVTLESLEEAMAQNVDLTKVGSGVVEPLVAGRIDRDVFPRLVQARHHEDTARQAEPAAQMTAVDVGSAISGQAELERLVRQEMERLRAEFAGQVRRGDYQAALHTGHRIETLFPDSALAEQFQSIREHLLRRAPEASGRESASAV